MMNSKVLFLAVIFCQSIYTNAQDTLTHPNQSKSPVVYTGIYNQLPESFNYPAIGVVNVAQGNQKSTHIGFTNINNGDLSGVQIGFSNTTSGQTHGVQVGFVNTVKENVKGVQTGFANITMQHIDGVQVGYLNYANQSGKGAQVGFVNAVGQSFDGAQVGFINVTPNDLNGVQTGFVNVSKEATEGAQVGFVNVTHKKITGTQVGFINIADSISNGVPVGFLSIVKHGGYYALEASSNELYTYNLAFKIGVKQLYTSIALGYNPDLNSEFVTGLGIGSLLSIHPNNKWYVNPELVHYSTPEKLSKQYTQLSTSLGFNYKQVSFKAGPTLVWSSLNLDSRRGGNEKRIMDEPNYNFGSSKINDNNRIHVGAKISLVYTFN